MIVGAASLNLEEILQEDNAYECFRLFMTCKNGG